MRRWAWCERTVCQGRRKRGQSKWQLTGRARRGRAAGRRCRLCYMPRPLIHPVRSAWQEWNRPQPPHEAAWLGQRLLLVSPHRPPLCPPAMVRVRPRINSQEGEHAVPCTTSDTLELLHSWVRTVNVPHHAPLQHAFQHAREPERRQLSPPCTPTPLLRQLPGEACIQWEGEF